MYPRLDSITHDIDYLTFYEKIQSLEKLRKFCRHNMAHFLDVARISYIISLEENAGISKELIYAAALLHDIGRHEQYLYGTPHEHASASLSLPILERAGFSEEEITSIQLAILNHRTPEMSTNKDLSGYLYRGDKASRACHSCKYESDCNWPENKKNLIIRW